MFLFLWAPAARSPLGFDLSATGHLDVSTTPLSVVLFTVRSPS
jgi:hypothetical protein